jgi:hypothetical protein
VTRPEASPFGQPSLSTFANAKVCGGLFESAQSLDSLDLATIPQELDSEGCPKAESKNPRFWEHTTALPFPFIHAKKILCCKTFQDKRSRK